MPLVTTVGGSTSDSYVSVANADTYFAADSHLLSATWLALTNNQKEAALRTAARQMNRLAYFGQQASDTQALAWPRVYRDLWTSDTIPTRIKQAQMEQALFLAQNSSTGGLTPSASAQAQGIQSVSIGDFSATYGASAGSSAQSPINAFGPDARALLKGFWTMAGHVYAGDRESPTAYDLDPAYNDAQRELDYD